MLATTTGTRKKNNSYRKAFRRNEGSAIMKELQRYATEGYECQQSDGQWVKHEDAQNKIEEYKQSMLNFETATQVEIQSLRAQITEARKYVTHQKCEAMFRTNTKHFPCACGLDNWLTKTQTNKEQQTPNKRI